MTAAEPLCTLRLRVNGDAVEVATRPSRTLLELLRYDLGLTGTKQGCDKGDCGACTVIIDGHTALSCLTLALDAEDRSVETTESLRHFPVADPILDAFDRFGAGQCGFCTPGMVMTAKSLLDRDPDPSRETVRLAISGNLCRCTGYRPIVEAVLLAAKIRRGEAKSGEGRPGAGSSEALPSLEKRSK